MRFKLGSSCSSGTVGRTLSVLRRFRSSGIVIVFGLTNPCGVAGLFKNARSCGGISAAASCVAAPSGADRLTLVLAWRFALLAMGPPSRSVCLLQERD